MTIYDDSKMKFYEESNMIHDVKYDHDVKDYEIIDFHERNTTVSKFSWDWLFYTFIEYRGMSVNILP